MSKSLVFISLSFFLLFSSSSCERENNGGDVIVLTKLGKIRGLLSKNTLSGRPYFSFRGIPFAQPPVSDFRFKDPKPVVGWEGILNATADGPVCPQLHISTNEVIGQEDCLSLNIYTDEIDNLKPVIVFIHGGGFVTGTGSSELYGPDLINGQSVVLVTVQYRLGVLGFLSMGEEGNWGLKDQLEGLRWIQNNIASFGGDPEKITLFGEGAGAASATLLTLTPLSKGLFRNVIVLGGTPLNSQYFQKDPLESARELGSRLKCIYDNLEELVNCLRSKKTENLVKESFFSFPRWFAPTVDKELFSKMPETMLKEGDFLKVPILIGLARHEGAFYYPLTLNSFNNGKYDGNFIDSKLPRLLPVISEFQTKLFPLTKILKKRYFTNIDFDNEDEFRGRYVEFLTDLLYGRFSSEYGNFLSNHSVPVYTFIFDYYGTNSIMNIIGDSDVKNIAHGDILQYIFTRILGDENDLPADDKIFATKTFLPVLINFAKASDPTSADFKWPLYTAEKQTVVSVGKTLSLLPDFRSNILKFWAENVPDLYKKKISDEKDEL